MIRKEFIEESARTLAREFGLTPEQTQEFVARAGAAYKKVGMDLFRYLAQMKAAA